MSHPKSNDANRNQQMMRFMMAVDEECRRMGGKHLLTPEEYLDVVSHCYREVFGIAPSQDDLPAMTG